MDLSALRVPVIAAPMAGGPSTPELVAAVSAAGGFGYLAAGYLTPDALREKIAATRALTDSPFGVNVFVPARLDEQRQGADVEAYRGELLAVADALGVELPQPRWDDTDHFADKIDLLVDDPVDTVSFTFGCPGADVVRRLQSAGSDVVVTVTDADEALAAAREGADALCVQGSQAGGHRSTHRVDAIPNDLSYVDLLREVRSVSALPLVAAGGIADGREAARALSLGRSRCRRAPPSCSPTRPAPAPPTGRACRTRPWTVRSSPGPSPAARRGGCATSSCATTTPGRCRSSRSSTSSPNRSGPRPPRSRTTSS